MRVVSPAQMKQIEQQAQRAGIPYGQMMEEAGRAAARWIAGRLRPGSRGLVLCGRGNNGGDGMVAARFLQQAGFDCRVALVLGPPATPEASHALEQLPAGMLLPREAGQALLQQARQADFLVDAVFGSGFSGRLPAPLAGLFAAINHMGKTCYALEIPSGVDCLSAGADPEALHCAATLAFHRLKPAHLFPRELGCLGKVQLLPIGFAPSPQEPCLPLLDWDASSLFLHLPRAAPASHKGQNGRLLAFTGSVGMAGAAVISARGALQCGVGYLTMAVSPALYPLLSGHLTDPVFCLLQEQWASQLAAQLARCDAVLAGCGLGLGPAAAQQLGFLLENCRVPLVLDADGLTLLASHPQWWHTIHAPLILTPHPGEFARLAACPPDGLSQAGHLGAAQQFARQQGATVVLKGADTVVAAPDGRFFVNHRYGNPGLAKAGSGDLLAGIIAALAARGMPPFEAAAAGVLLHALAGDRCARRRSVTCTHPGDLLEELPALFRQAGR